jgi:hypothetical protein
MAEVHTIEHRGSEKLRGRDRRSLNLSTKLTAVEAKAIEDAASRAGKTPSEWAREMLLRSDVVGSHTEMEMHIFTELVLGNHPKAAIDYHLKTGHREVLRHFW